MSKGRQFKYVKQHKASFKPVKSTRIRNKSSNIKNNEMSSLEKIFLSAFIRTLSIICWALAFAILIQIIG
jgi:cytoskeletal protein RodZ